MSNNILVSVAMATYNGDKFIREQLDSIINQTYKNIEIIVSDDCSSDTTAVILHEYHKKYGIKYSINQTNMGFVKNFENAIRQCRGEFIALSDQDDIWNPDKIEILINEIGNSSMICSDASIIDDSGNTTFKSLYDHTGRTFFTSNQFSYLLYENYITGCTIMFNRSILEHSIPFPDKTPYHDWFLALIASSSNGIKFLSRPLIQYRYHGNNQSQTARKSNIKTVMKRIIHFMKPSGTVKSQDTILFLNELTKRITPINYQLLPVIESKIAFYNDISRTHIHFHAFLLVIKNRKYFLAQKSFVQKMIFCTASLFV